MYSSIIPVEIVADHVNNSTKIITYIGDDAYTAPIAHIKQVGGTAINGYHYLHRDYLGSILAITNAAGTVLEQRQFGAWGTTNKFVDSQTNTTFGYSSLINRGFTGHEHFFDVALIHMNGRMYDAQLGRFLSPDNYIQDPFNTQSFNRYGYVWNNPLSFNDPDGEIIVAALIGAAIGVITNGINNSIHGRGFFKGAGTAALIGAIGGAASFGIGEMALSIGQGLTSSGQWLAQTSFQMGAHAILGGYMNVFQSGEFGAGALSGAFGSVFGGTSNSLLKNAGGVLRAVGTTFSGAISGGFGSVMAGGNFLEGARNGAISAGLNHAMHTIQQNVATKKLISNMEQAIEAQREAMLKFIKSDPYNPTHDSFNAIDFNIKEYAYKRGILADNEYYGLSGKIRVGGKTIDFKATYMARPDNYVTYIKHIGSGATVFGRVLVNSFAMTGSGTVVRLNIPSNSDYQYLRDYIYR